MGTRLIIVLCIAVVSLLAVWHINGAMVTPVKKTKNIDIQICVKARGEVPELEHTVMGLLWLIENGTLPGEIVIYDAGMDDYTRMTAEMLAGDDWRIHFADTGETWSRKEN